MPKIFIAGGGSGGHVAPAIAIAEALQALDCESIIAHSTRAIDERMTSQTPFQCMTLPASPLSFAPSGLFKFCTGFIKTDERVRKIINEESIDCVVATGGFVAAPALRASRKMGCPTVLLNLDDPPGKANRLATRWADTVLSTVNCSLANAVSVPPPLRQSVLTPENTKLSYEKFELDPHRLTLLITGASQGAGTLNKFIPELAKNHPMQFQGWQVLHISGPEHSKEVEKNWSETVVPFHVVEFVQNMGDAWGVSDFAITRGGANTIAELAMNAVPAIVFPYPYHKDDHQRTNALPLASTGGIWIEKDYIQTPQNLLNGGRSIVKMLKDHHRRFEMRQSLVSNLPVNGAKAIADACLACIKSQ